MCRARPRRAGAWLANAVMVTSALGADVRLLTWPTQLGMLLSAGCPRVSLTAPTSATIHRRPP